MSCTPYNMSISNIVLPFVANPAQMSPLDLTGRELGQQALRRGPCKRTLLVSDAAPLRAGCSWCTGIFFTVYFALVAELDGQRTFEPYTNFLDKGTDLISIALSYPCH